MTAHICTTNYFVKSPLGEWQSKNWDPEVGTTTFDEFCTALTKGFGLVEADLADLPFNHTSRMVTLGPGFSVDLAIVNYANWIKAVRTLYGFSIR